MPVPKFNLLLLGKFSNIFILFLYGDKLFLLLLFCLFLLF